MRLPGWAGAVRMARRRPALVGFVAGAAAATVLTLVVSAYLPPLFDDGWEAGTIIIVSGRDDSLGGQRQALIDQWNAMGDRPKAVIKPVEGDADAVHAELTALAQEAAADVDAGGQGVDDRPDIYNLDVPWMAQFVTFGYLRPLDEDRVDLDGFLDKPLETCWRDGRLWALPFNTDAGLLYYRSDLLGRDNLTQSGWPVLKQYIERVLTGPGAPVEAGYTTQLADYEGLSVNAFEAIWAAQGEVIDAEQRVLVDQPAAREGIARLAGGLERTNPQVILPDSRDFREGESTKAFLDGRVVFMRNWPVAHRDLVHGEQTDPAGSTPTAGSVVAPSAAAQQGQFAVTQIPGPSVLGGQNLAIAAGTDQPRAAQELIEFLTSPRSQQVLFERGGFAATREIVYHDQAVQREYPYAGTLLSAIKTARARPDTPYYALFSEVFREGIQHALSNGGEPPDGFAEDLAAAFEGHQPD